MYHELNFHDYLESELKRSDLALDVPPLYHRLAFFRDLILKLEEIGLVFGAAPKLFGGAQVCRKPAEVLMNAITKDRAMNIALTFEAETRNQANCDLWKILRRCMMTASSMKWNKYGPYYEPEWQLEDTKMQEMLSVRSILFGNTNEPLVRAMIMAYRLGPSIPKTPDGLDPSHDGVFVFDDEKSPEPYTCGLLLDHRTGMMGASMDMLICDRDSSGKLAPHHTEKTLEIYEIKCRAKYIFCATDITNKTARMYNALMKDRSFKAFKRFINSISKPCIEYFDPKRLPSAAEALVTCDESWKRRDDTAKRERCFHIDRHHLLLNKAGRSSVLLFSEPNLDTRTVCQAPWADGSLILETPVFANPKHSNFKQIFVQHYVLSGYFPEHKIQPFLVTFFGRVRKPEEVGIRFELSGTLGVLPYAGFDLSISPEQAIPVALIFTPVEVDTALFEVIEKAGLRAFDTTATQLWDKLNPTGAVDGAAEETY
ncbi:UL12 [anatid alphaherpesvirus 1]|uniref:UL12 n=1 Tax=anatid alphaherpesvirus 1 TaxID=104388 RepID=C6ZD32_9ALPH|nr:UL12 [Anatid alphaherpesvirus 1]ACT83563.1 UL12 [Anatid alphaherpesvirus 1]UJO49844.1 UL12 [Anatid alphaherpesvirus 1]UJO49919.1 UL12 [Anatid alphaherpesvirus 1]WKE35631.1 UL12 [Anatid alphaherpesvirus 1]